MNTEETPLPDSPEEIPPATPKKGGWWRRLLVCNPFFLCSAALLLFAINRLYNDHGFLSGETQKLLFNFSALQVYELLLAGTAILLARRRVWYDSALLVVLENGLVLVPFMLISQADLIDNRFGWALTAAGGLAVAARLGAIKRWYPQFNLPGRAIALGAVLLLINVALPRIFRTVIEPDYYNWHIPNLIAWYVALPIIVASANLLPRPSRYGGLNPERHWLPLFLYALWAAGTGVHIWCVGHIAARPFEIVLLAPAVWATAWTVRNRLTDFVPNPRVALQNAVLVIAFLSPFVAFGEPEIFTRLAVLNVVAFGVLWLRRPSLLARELMVISLLTAVAGVPLEWSLLAATRAEHIGLALAAYAILWAIRSPNPEAGLLGAFATGVVIAWLTRAWSIHAGLQPAFVFLLIHSLRWPEQSGRPDAAIRYLAAVMWVVDAILWTREGWDGQSGYIAAGALLACTAWGFLVWRQKRRGPLAIPMASAATALTGPANWFIVNSSLGLMALAASFLLFAVGAALAFTRHRWDRNGADCV